MRYRLLGPLQVVGADSAVDVGPHKQRVVLAALLLARGRVVSVDRLVDAVWGEQVPASATASLQAYISNLRRALRAAGGENQMASSVAQPIVRQPPGYYLDVDPESVDVTVFAARCARAAAAVEAERWDEGLAEADAALSLVRGPLLEDLPDAEWAREEAQRVSDLQTECLADKVISLLALGRVPAALTEVARLRAVDPLADRGARLQMLTLYRAGRVAEALETYTRHAELLDGELGLEPGPQLRELQTAILRQAPELAAWPRSPEWTGAATISGPTVDAAATAVVEPAAHRTPLVGRYRELSVAEDILARVASGATRWLVLSGPPGIGKTRLAEEISERVSAGGGQVVWVGCPDEQATPPWWPMRQLVRGLGADADSVLEVPTGADPDTARFLVYERIQALLESTDTTLAVVVDDVQWSDPTSASCLAYIAGALRGRPVLMLVTVRDGERSPEVARLLSTVARGEANRHIEVPALSSADVATLADEIAEEPVTADEAAELADRTGGNPFFVSEYARLPRAERVGAEIPHAVRAVLERRLAALDPVVVQVLRTAAVIGDGIDAAAVPVLAKTTGLDLDTLADHLDDAADERIIVSAYGGEGYVFAHGLLREQLLAGMPALRRQRVHAKVGEVLAESTDADAPTRRAQHLVAAQPLVEPAEVVQACRLAAEQATAQWSSDIAARWWQAALDAYDRLPAPVRDDEERDALTVELLEAHSRAGRGQLVLDSVHRYLGEALRTGRTATAGRVASALLRASGGWPWLAPGREPGELLGVLERAAALAADDPAAGARVRSALAVGNCYHPDPTVAATLLDDADQLAEAADDPDVTADVLIGRLITYSGMATHARQTLEWVERLNRLQHSRSREDTVIAHSVATMAAMNLGDLAAARRHLQAGIAGSDELQLPVLRAQLRWMEAVVAAWVGDFAEAERHHAIAAHVHEQTELYEAGSGLLATATLLREKGGPVPAHFQPVGDIEAFGGPGVVSVVRTGVQSLGRGPQARAEAEATLRTWAAHDEAHIWPTLGHHTLLAHLAADHGLTEFADLLLERLAPFGDRIAVLGQVGSAGPVSLATARLHALRGDAARARADVARTRELAERTGGVPTLLRARLLECELGEPGPARTAALQALAADAAAIGMVSVVDAAHALV
ncbi:AAA family ATPase [Mycolicibacterium flavescens]|uniref:AAA family ATPase n=1 Tax=Mycolicibacterium flavescens TaxID=1776 RepID=A0A1E3R860_MYCFV|nr:BTAD domain-containing putative transcriptional regulator [Mycolicibacterium flavescens]MCV7280034.1 AAA family ATPase [Mycolicibacterium flavescens]ODQ86136.1 AAA family ATPase [Mycolicibacterium flavescens]